jgi:hypothetical protein
MNATSSELLMLNFNEIFIELDPVKRAALLAELLRGRLSLDPSWRSHCGPRGYQ